MQAKLCWTTRTRLEDLRGSSPHVRGITFVSRYFFPAIVGPQTCETVSPGNTELGRMHALDGTPTGKCDLCTLLDGGNGPSRSDTDWWTLQPAGRHSNLIRNEVQHHVA